MTNATLLQTQVTPNDCGIQRGSGCSLRAPCPNSGPRRWLSRCLCLMHRGRWPDPLPSSCSLGWWRLHFTVGREESQSRAEQSADECSARIGDSAPNNSTSSASWYIFSGSVSLGGGCSSSVLSSVPWSSGCCSSAGKS
jgi:hypothetical protein